MKNAYGEKTFNCPHCEAKTQHIWSTLRVDNFDGGYKDIGLVENLLVAVQKVGESNGVSDNLNGYKYQDIFAVSLCISCEKFSSWYEGDIVYPMNEAQIPSPEEHMPVEIKKLYNEAKSVYHLSFRSSCALLRLALEKLLIIVGAKGNSINSRINNLVVEQKIPTSVQQALDTIRILGNDGVHPGVIDISDNERKENALMLFLLLNIIVDRMIKADMQIQQFYSLIPESKRKAIEQRDK